MPPKKTTWDKAQVRYVLVVVEGTTAVRIEVGYDMGDVADAEAAKHEVEVLLPPGPRFVAADALVAALIEDVKQEEGL